MTRKRCEVMENEMANKCQISENRIHTRLLPLTYLFWYLENRVNRERMFKIIRTERTDWTERTEQTVLQNGQI